MKKVYLLLLAAGMFTFVACNSGENKEGEESTTETEAVSEDATEDVGTPTEATEATGEQLVDHVCNDQCTKEACNLKHGEKGHACSEACHTESKENES